MPEISRFLGIIIRMFMDDHNPPHFHAVYNGKEGAFSIETLIMIQGDLPPRIQGIVVEWAAMHQKELLQNWENLHSQKQIKKIKPLV